MIDRLLEILKVVKPEANTEGVTEATNLRFDLGLDSMSMLLLAFNVEEEFGIQFGEEPIQLETVKDVCDFIRAKGGK